MATITPVATSTAGATVTYAAASAGGDTIACGSNSPRVTLLVRNASASPITVTLAGAIQCSQGALHNVTINCPVGDTDTVIPSQCIPANGNVAVTYSASASVTVAAITS